MVRWLVVLFLAFPASLPAADAPPNFIFLITDDISADDLGCYGNQAIQTPHLDALAAEGLRFQNCYVTASSCSPSRCSIITGRYPHNTGAPELHTNLPMDQKCFPEVLRKKGYYTLLSGKNHMGKVERAFEVIEGGKGPGREETWVQRLRERPADRPFFFWLASTDAHRDWAINADAPVYDPEKIPVPPFLVDGPETRADFAGYYHEVSRVDHFVGELVKTLREEGLDSSTWLVFTADNGRPFPRCKTRVYDSGAKVPLLVWAPGRIQPGVRQNLVSTIDLSATFLELAGCDIPETIQGQSMVPSFRDAKAAPREILFAEHNWHVFQAHERMVRFGDWMYIRNAWPDRMNMAVESGPHFPAGKELWDAQAKNQLEDRQRDVFMNPRAPEEMFNVMDDPHQLANRISDPEAAAALAQARKLVDQWTDQTGDTVPRDPTTDRESPQGEKFKSYKRGEFPGASRNASGIQHPGPFLFPKP